MRQIKNNFTTNQIQEPLNEEVRLSNQNLLLLRNENEILENSFTLKRFQCLISQHTDEEIDSSIKSYLESYDFDDLFTLHRIVHRLNTWFNIFTNSDRHMEFVKEKCQLDKKFPITNRQTFETYRKNYTNLLIKSTLKDRKSYLMTVIYTIKRLKQYSTLEIIDLMFSISLFDDDEFQSILK